MSLLAAVVTVRIVSSSIVTCPPGSLGAAQQRRRNQGHEPQLQGEAQRRQRRWQQHRTAYFRYRFSLLPRFASASASLSGRKLPP
jgi:hypothetical protein